MKEYEDRWQLTLPAGGYKILRVDGRSFSTWTAKNCQEKPFDQEFSAAMDWAALQLCKEIQNARFAFVQSDEISVLIAETEPKTQQWFGGDVCKTVSISAALASNEFNVCFGPMVSRAQFDSRVFTLPNRLTVEKYFLDRQANSYTNAVSMLAGAHFSPKQLHGMSVYDRLRMLAEAGVHTADQRTGDFFGRLAVPVQVMENVTWTHKKTGVEHLDTVWRKHWKIDTAQWFDWDVRTHLGGLIP